MKKILFFMMAMLPLMFIGCSDDDEGGDRGPVESIKNTSWKYSEEEIEHTQKEFKDYENESLLKDLLNHCPDLKYTAGERKNAESKIITDLCKKETHEPHIQASLDFYENNCILHEKTYKYVQSTKLNEESCDYKFVEGKYIGVYGIGYVGYTVKEYGIYRADTSGDVLVLALDGNFTYNLKIKRYSSTVKKEIISDNEVSASYAIKDGEIIISNNEYKWKGILDSQKVNIKLSEISPTTKEKYVLSRRN